MAASSAPAAKAALLALLAADAGMTGVQVEYAHPGARIQQEAAYFHRTIENEVPHTMGTQSRLEDYIVELVVDVAQDGDDAQAAEERCWALVAVLENILRTHQTLSGALNQYADLEGVDMTPYGPGGQRLAEAVCRVHCRHRK